MPEEPAQSVIPQPAKGIAYTSAYFNVVAPVLRYLLRKRYGADLARRAYVGARDVYREMLAEVPPIGAKNPMANNIYLCCVFLALYRNAAGEITPEMLRAVVHDIFDLKLVRGFMGLGGGLNNPATMRRMAKGIEANARWPKEHPEFEPYTWDFNLGDTKGDTQICYHFTRCPLNDFAREQGLLEVLPVMCEVDHLMIGTARGRLIRHHTLAEGGPMCDYLIVAADAPEPEGPEA